MSEDKDFPSDRDVADASRSKSRLESLVPDSLKKLLLAGTGAVFMTEEGIRNMLSEMKLPKEMASAILNQAERSRKELLKIIGRELRHMLEAVDVVDWVQTLLRDMEMEVTWKVRFNPREDKELVSDDEIHDEDIEEQGSDTSGDLEPYWEED